MYIYEDEDPPATAEQIAVHVARFKANQKKADEFCKQRDARQAQERREQKAGHRLFWKPCIQPRDNR